LAAAANTTSVTGTAQNGSGVTYTVFLQGPTVADATIVFRMNKITVGTGEGAQFVVGKFYFITDHTARNAVNSFQVASKSGDVLTVNYLYRPFPLGAKIWSYGHPFFVGGTGTSLWSNKSSVPYYNVAGSMAKYISFFSGACEQTSLDVGALGTSWNGTSSNLFGPLAFTSAEDNYIARMSPDRQGRWAVQRPGIVEKVAFGESSNVSVGATGVTAYGQLKNVIVGSVGTMSPNLHGRTLSAIDYTYFRTIASYSNGAQAYAAMIRETQSNT
jgi:hypothetical protein